MTRPIILQELEGNLSYDTEYDPVMTTFNLLIKSNWDGVKAIFSEQELVESLTGLGISIDNSAVRERYIYEPIRKIFQQVGLSVVCQGGHFEATKGIAGNVRLSPYGELAEESQPRYKLRKSSFYSR